MMRITFNDAELTDGLVLIGTQGLGSSEAEISITDYALINGGIVSKNRIPSREIVLSYAVTDAHPEEARIRARKVFQMGIKGTLRIRTGYKDVMAEAYVKRVECDLWAAKQQIDVTLSCPDPYLYNVQSKTFSPANQITWRINNSGEPVGFVVRVRGTGGTLTVGDETITWGDTGRSGNVYLDTREGHYDLYSLSGSSRTSLVEYITTWNFPQIPTGDDVVVTSDHANYDMTITERWLGI